MGDRTLANYRRYKNLLGFQVTKWFIHKEGMLFTFPLSQQDYNTGAPDLAAIEALRVLLTDDGKDDPIYHLQAIAVYENAPRGSASIMFDDGHFAFYFNALPILSSVGMPAALPMAHDAIDRKSYISKRQMTELQKEHGWEIAAHAPGNDMRKRPLEQNRQYLQNSKAYWRENDFEVEGFVFAGGRSGYISDA